MVARARLKMPISYLPLLIKLGSKMNSALTSAYFGDENKVHFWIPHEILYVIDILLHFLNLLFRSASFGKLRLSS